MVNRLIRSTHFDAVFATINQTLSPVYIGIVLAFLMCPIYNKLVRCFYHFLYKDGKLLTDSFGSMYFNTKVPKRQKEQRHSGRSRKPGCWHPSSVWPLWRVSWY